MSPDIQQAYDDYKKQRYASGQAAIDIASWRQHKVEFALASLDHAAAPLILTESKLDLLERITTLLQEKATLIAILESAGAI